MISFCNNSDVRNVAKISRLVYFNMICYDNEGNAICVSSNMFDYSST